MYLNFLISDSFLTFGKFSIQSISLNILRRNFDFMVSML